MKSRWFMCVFALAVYSVSLVHTVLPHHHYASYNEYKGSVVSHHHEKKSENGHDDHHDGNAGQQSPDGLFFLTHVSNIEFFPSKFSYDQKVKVKIQRPDIRIEDNPIACAYSNKFLFHIPDLPLRADKLVLSSRSLRAPPFYCLLGLDQVLCFMPELG